MIDQRIPDRLSEGEEPGSPNVRSSEGRADSSYSTLTSPASSGAVLRHCTDSLRVYKPSQIEESPVSCPRNGIRRSVWSSLQLQQTFVFSNVQPNLALRINSVGHFALLTPLLASIPADMERKRSQGRWDLSSTGVCACSWRGRGSRSSIK